MISKRAASFRSAYRDKSNHSSYGGSFEKDRRAAEAVELEKVKGGMQLTQIGKENYARAARDNSESLHRFNDYEKKHRLVALQLGEMHRKWAHGK